MAKETEWTKPIRERFTQYRNERPSIRSYGNAELDRMLDDAVVVIFVGCATIEAQAERIDKLVEALEEIEKGEGPFARDQLKHAENTIESMKQIARAALAEVKP